MTEVTQWMSIQEVAKTLGVTAPRVRQLVTERKLPEPTKFGERASLWSRSDVEALRFTQDNKGILSDRAALLSPPNKPLKRIIDDVFIPSLRRWASEPYKIHVRIFQGEIGEVNRTVVIASEIPGGGAITSQFEEVASEITARYLNGNTHAVTWFQTRFGHSLFEDYVYDVQNVVLQSESSRLMTATAESWIDRLPFRSKHNPPTTSEAVRYFAPAWNQSSIDEVQQLIGENIEWYPKEAYSTREIENWQRNKRPRTVEVDPLRLKPLVDALEAMTRIQRDHPYNTAAKQSCTILANIAFLNNAEDGRLTLKNTAANYIQNRLDYQSTHGIGISAATLAPYRLVDNDLALVNAYATKPPTVPWELDTESTLDLYLELRSWRDETGQHSATPDLTLNNHLQTILSWIRSPFLETALQARKDVYPLGLVRTFRPEGHWDEKYLASINFTSAIDESNRTYREIHHQTRGDSPDRSNHYGYDPYGNLVANNSDTDYPTFSVYWPSKPSHIPLNGQIVSDGATGDRPAYIVENGKIVGLLSQFPSSHHHAWNFGYSGGGPGRLAGDIIKAIMWQESLPPEAMPWRWLDDLIFHADRDHLSVDIADIMRRVNTDTN